MDDIITRLRSWGRCDWGEETITGDVQLYLDAADEIERLRIENIQLKFACGYPMPAELEKHIIPSNPFKCGICAARKNDN